MTAKTWGLLFVLFTGLLLGQAPTNRNTMKAVASGKDAVLDYLEKDARQRLRGKSGGAYELYTDDAGNSLLIIDGHIFHGRLAFEDIIKSLGELGGAPPDTNFLFDQGIITETETVDKK